jgi:hypothetical protein
LKVLEKFESSSAFQNNAKEFEKQKRILEKKREELSPLFWASSPIPLSSLLSLRSPSGPATSPPGLQIFPGGFQQKCLLPRASKHLPGSATADRCSSSPSRCPPPPPVSINSSRRRRPTLASPISPLARSRVETLTLMAYRSRSASGYRRRLDPRRAPARPPLGPAQPPLLPCRGNRPGKPPVGRTDSVFLVTGHRQPA